MYTHNAVVLPLKQRSTRRRFVVMDIENVNGGSVIDVALAKKAYNQVANAIDLLPNEQVAIGVGPSSLLAVGQSSPRARVVMGRGLSGADHALLEVLREEQLAERFDEVVIVSGDGIFADVAAWLAIEGLEVTVVSRKGNLSKRLQLAASKIAILPEEVPTHKKVA